MARILIYGDSNTHGTVPLVALGLLLLRGWAVSPWVKFTLIVAGASVATLVSYRYLVRFTPIGRALNGPRKRGGS